MKRSYRVERLARREEKLVIKRIFTLSALSVIIIVVLFTLGIPALGKFADLLDKVFKKGSQSSQQAAIISPPHFDQLPSTTNQNTIDISGFAPSGNKVELYINDQRIDDVDITDGKFQFKGVNLVNSENRIKAKATDASGAGSDFSAEKVVTLDTTAPSLDVTTPVDGQTFSQNNRVKIEGTTEKDAQVYANGFLANVTTTGSFDVTIPLVEGDNNIEVKAFDEAGNSKIVSVKVSFRK